MNSRRRTERTLVAQEVYSSLLTPTQRASGYSLSAGESLQDSSDDVAYVIRLYYKDDPVGYVEVEQRKQLFLKDANISQEHRGKGLGVPLFEAAIVHGRSIGRKVFQMGYQSTAAHEVWKKVAAKHRFTYDPAPSSGPQMPVGPYDGRFAPTKVTVTKIVRSGIAS